MASQPARAPHHNRQEPADDGHHHRSLAAAFRAHVPAQPQERRSARRDRAPASDCWTDCTAPCSRSARAMASTSRTTRRGQRGHRDRARTDLARSRYRGRGERAGARTRAGRRRRRAAARGRERRRSRREPRPLLGPRPATARSPSSVASSAPGGELRFYEHVIPRCQPNASCCQSRRPQRPAGRKIAGGCHPARDTATAIEHAGFQIQSSERIMFAASALEPTIPYILGVARRP